MSETTQMSRDAQDLSPQWKTGLFSPIFDLEFLNMLLSVCDPSMKIIRHEVIYNLGGYLSNMSIFLWAYFVKQIIITRKNKDEEQRC